MLPNDMRAASNFFSLTEHENGEVHLVAKTLLETEASIFDPYQLARSQSRPVQAIQTIKQQKQWRSKEHLEMNGPLQYMQGAYVCPYCGIYETQFKAAMVDETGEGTSSYIKSMLTKHARVHGHRPAWQAEPKQLKKRTRTDPTHRDYTNLDVAVSYILSVTHIRVEGKHKIPMTAGYLQDCYGGDGLTRVDFLAYICCRVGEAIYYANCVAGKAGADNNLSHLRQTTKDDLVGGIQKVCKGFHRAVDCRWEAIRNIPFRTMYRLVQDVFVGGHLYGESTIYLPEDDGRKIESPVKVSLKQPPNEQTPNAHKKRKGSPVPKDPPPRANEMTKPASGPVAKNKGTLCGLGRFCKAPLVSLKGGHDCYFCKRRCHSVGMGCMIAASEDPFYGREVGGGCHICLLCDYAEKNKKNNDA